MMPQDENATISELFKSILERFDPVEGQSYTLLDFAIRNELEIVKEYLDDSCMAEDLADEKNELMLHLVTDTRDFLAPDAVFGVLSPGFKYDYFFEQAGNDIDQRILDMSAANPKPEIVRMAAELMAEWGRFRILRSNQFHIDLAKYVRQDFGNAGLAHESRKAAMRDSVIAVQNAMVDYVATEGSLLPLHRAAAMFHVLDDSDVPPATSRLWKEKIVDFKISQKYHPKHGDFTNITPVFAPPA